MMGGMCIDEEHFAGFSCWLSGVPALAKNDHINIIDPFAITVRARVTWLADLRHQGTVTATWPNGTADIAWDTGWYSTRVPLTQLRRLAT